MQDGSSTHPVAADRGLERDTFAEFAAEAPIGIVRADAAGMCTYANAAWFTLTGLTFAETVGHAWSKSVHPDDLDRTMAAWAASVASGRAYVNELRLVAGDGSVKRVIAHANATRDADGTITGYVGTIMDVTPLVEAEHFLRRLIAVQEDERRSLCHDFHDGLIQHVLAAQMLLESYRLRNCPDGECAELDDVIDYLRRGVVDARRLIRGIRSSVLDDLGLVAAIDELAEQMADFGISVDREVDPRIEREPVDQKTTIYRVLQEALTNVRKHSGDQRPRLTVRRSDDDVELVVQDRGVGFDVVTAGTRGFGLAGMAERVRLQRGTCRVESQPGRGTRIVVRLPIEQQAAVKPQRRDS